MKFLLTLFFLVFLLLIGTWIAAEYFVQTVQSAHAQLYLDGVRVVGREAWDFGAPLLRLLVVLLVLQWFLQRNEFKMPSAFSSLNWDARMVVALLVVVTFCISALGGFMMEGLKEATLVVLGFYFGSLQRNVSEKGA